MVHTGNQNLSLSDINKQPLIFDALLWGYELVLNFFQALSNEGKVISAGKLPGDTDSESLERASI